MLAWSPTSPSWSPPTQLGQDPFTGDHLPQPTATSTMVPSSSPSSCRGFRVASRVQEPYLATQESWFMEVLDTEDSRGHGTKGQLL